MGGRVHRRTRALSGRAGRRADERTNGRTSGQGRARWADERTGGDNERTGGQVGGLADGRTTDF